MPYSTPRQGYLLLISLLLALLFNGLLIALVGYEQSRAVAITPLHPRRIEQYVAQKAPAPLPTPKPGAQTATGEQQPGSEGGKSTGDAHSSRNGDQPQHGTGGKTGGQGSLTGKWVPAHPSSSLNSHAAENGQPGHSTATGHFANGDHYTSTNSQQHHTATATPDRDNVSQHNGTGTKASVNSDKHGNGARPNGHAQTGVGKTHAGATGNHTPAPSSTHGNGQHGSSGKNAAGHGTEATRSSNSGNQSGHRGRTPAGGGSHQAAGEAGTHGNGQHGSGGNHSEGHGTEIANAGTGGNSAGHGAGTQGSGNGHRDAGEAGRHDNGTQHNGENPSGGNGHGNLPAAGAGSAGDIPGSHGEAPGTAPQANSNTGSPSAGSSQSGSATGSGSGSGASSQETGAGNIAGNAQQATDALTDKPYPKVTYKITGPSELSVHYRNPEMQTVLDARNVQGAALDAKTPTYPTAVEPVADAAKDPLTYPILPPYVKPLQGKPGGVAVPTVLPVPQTFDVGALSWRGAISFPSHFLLVPSSAGRPIPTELQGDGSGILGLYYQGANFEHLMFRRADPNIAFDWSHHRPDPRMPVSAYSIRWVGSIIPRYSERYTIYTATDDGVRLWLNGKQVIDKWQIQAISENQTTIDLTAGKPCDFVMEFFEKNGISYVQAFLYWQSAHQQKENIPESCLKFPDWLWDTPQ